MRPAGRMSGRSLVAGAAIGAGLARVRAGYLHWGAGTDEVFSSRPGDELIPDPDLIATRAVTIHATPERVWPWLAQIGHGRAGFYSYDFLENLVGCDIHSADHLVPQWQAVHVGALVKLHPDIAMTVARVQPGRLLVLEGAVPMGPVKPPYVATWTFQLTYRPDGTSRLVLVERYGYLRRWAPLLLGPVVLVSFLMSRRMLHGIRDRAERDVARGHVIAETAP